MARKYDYNMKIRLVNMTTIYYVAITGQQKSQVGIY